MVQLGAFLAMSVAWGLTWIAAKAAMATTPPVLLAGIRLALAACCFGIWALATRLPLRVTSPGRIILAGLLINTGCYSLMFWGIARSPTGLAAIVNLALIPIFSMTIGALHGEERITGRRVLALALGALGLVLLFATGERAPAEHSGEEGRIALGLAAVALGTLSYAWGAVVSKPLVRGMPPVAVAFWQTAIGGVTLMAASAVLEGPSLPGLQGLTAGPAMAGLAFLVLIGSLVGFSVYLWLLREWGAFRAGLYAFVSPVIAVAVGVLWAGEPFGAHEAVGMAVLLGAAALAIERRRGTAHPNRPVAS